VANALAAREVLEGQPQLGLTSGVRLLVVDDDPRVCRSIANAMSRVGFHVFTAEDGAPALEITEHARPDVAIVDFNMPTPGLTVVERLKTIHGAAIHIAVLSGQDDDETRAACFAAGADDVMSKPVNMTELRRRMVAAAQSQQAHVDLRLAQDRTDRRLAYGAEAAAMLAHDLNNGLVSALSNLSQLGGAVQRGELGETESQALTAAIRTLRRMSGLVANFVDIQRFEDAAVKPKTSTNNVRAMIQEVIEVHASVPANTIRFEIDCDPALAGTFDLALIERVLHNLVGNAIRYCSAGGLIRLSARSWDPFAASSVEIVVFNSGPPVPDSMRDDLFGKLGKGGNGKRGLGLYFCRLACEAHAGTISYRPTDGGVTFRIRLPGRT
jgi:two-component system, sensor histidine kinase and response regulator